MQILNEKLTSFLSASSRSRRRSEVRRRFEEIFRVNLELLILLDVPAFIEPESRWNEATFFQARAKFELCMSSPDEPELVKIPSSLSFLLIKAFFKSKLEPTTSFSEI